MLTTLLIYGYLGMIIYIIFDILDFNKKTPGLRGYETLQLYFIMPNILKLFAGVILVAVYVTIALMDGGDWLLKYTSFGIIDDSTPALFCFFMFIVGIANQFILDKNINLLSKAGHNIEVK